LAKINAIRLRKALIKADFMPKTLRAEPSRLVVNYHCQWFYITRLYSVENALNNIVLLKSTSYHAP
jgi:hypothetical protein